MWKDRPALLMDGPPSKRPVPDLSNNPAGGIRTKIIGTEENAIHVTADAGCDTVGLEMSVKDSAAGREIQFESARQSLASLAKAQATVVLTGLYRWPGGKECDASILWAADERR